MATTEHTTELDDTDIENTATDLQESFEEMSTLMDDLSETMGEVADGFAAFGQETSGPNAPTRSSSTSSFGAADD
jgi:hypothetical protein